MNTLEARPGTRTNRYAHGGIVGRGATKSMHNAVDSELHGSYVGPRGYRSCKR